MIKHWVFLFLALFFALPAFAEDAGSDKAVAYKLKIGEEERIYYLYAPGGASKKLRPVVFMFHDMGSTSEKIETTTRFTALAKQHDFLVVYPEGRGFQPTWNAGTCCGYAQRNGVDDVGFVRAILADIEKYHGVDKRYIYASGLGNGGMLAYRLACDMGDVFTAIAPVSAAMNVEVCMPGNNRTSAVIFHAGDDPVIPFEGGKSKQSADAPHSSVDKAMLYWLAQNMCRNIPKVDRNDHYSTTIFYCAEYRNVVLHALREGGHSWPTKPDASALIWEFFSTHPTRPLF